MTSFQQGATPLFARISPRKRERVLSAATEEFAINGFHNANVNTIAKNAGISVGALYKYFQTKEDIFFYIAEIAYKRIKKYTEEIFQSEGSFFDKIEGLLRLAQIYSVNDPHLVQLYNVFTSDQDPLRSRQLAHRLESVTADAYYQLILQAQKSGEIRQDLPPSVLAFMLDNQLMAVQFSFASSYYEERFQLYMKELPTMDGDTLISTMMVGLRDMFLPQKNAEP